MSSRPLCIASDVLDKYQRSFNHLCVPSDHPAYGGDQTLFPPPDAVANPAGSTSGYEECLSDINPVRDGAETEEKQPDDNKHRGWIIATLVICGVAYVVPKVVKIYSADESKQVAHDSCMRRMVNLAIDSRRRGRFPTRRQLIADGVEVATHADRLSQLICPLTGELVQDPVIASDGYLYERAAIERMMVYVGRPISPMTKLAFKSNELRPDPISAELARNIANAMEQFQFRRRMVQHQAVAQTNVVTL